MKSAVQLFRFVSCFPFAVNGTEPAGVEDSVAFAVADFEDVLAEVGFVDRGFWASRPRLRFDGDAIDTEKLLRCISGVEIIEPHCAGDVLSSEEMEREEQNRMELEKSNHARELAKGALGGKNGWEFKGELS